MRRGRGLVREDGDVAAPWEGDGAALDDAAAWEEDAVWVLVGLRTYKQGG